MNRKWWTLAAVSIATFMLLLDITVVNTALPSIQRDLGGTFADLQWVVDAYTLSLAAIVLAAGSPGRRLRSSAAISSSSATSPATRSAPKRSAHTR